MCFWYFMSEVKNSIIPVKSLYAMHDKHKFLPIARYLQKNAQAVYIVLMKTNRLNYKETG